MKVSEAKTKICPFIQNVANVITTVISAGNAAAEAYEVAVEKNIPSNINCICGDCMAWGWYKIEEDGWKTDKDSTTEGYCKRLGQ